MNLRRVLVTAISVVMLALAGNVLAGSQAEATANALSDIATSVKTDTQAVQESANVAVEGSNAVNAARQVGVATSAEAQEADVAAEAASAAAADMISAKDVSAQVAKEAESDVAMNHSARLISGDEPINVGNSAQIQAPHPSASAQEKTSGMLKKEAGLISGDTNPVDEGDAAQLKAPRFDAKAQAATQMSLEKSNNEAGAITGKYD